jgi:hypothetical protein
LSFLQENKNLVFFSSSETHLDKCQTVVLPTENKENTKPVPGKTAGAEEAEDSSEESEKSQASDSESSEDDAEEEEENDAAEGQAEGTDQEAKTRSPITGAVQALIAFSEAARDDDQSDESNSDGDF